MRLSVLLFGLIALGLAACVGGHPDGNVAKTPPTGYVRMTEETQFGVIHEDHPAGFTEIFVRLNRTGTPERARNMAFYAAARTGAQKQAESFVVLQDKADMYCHRIVHRGPGIFVIGDPISMAASFAATAVSKSIKTSEYLAFPMHLLSVAYVEDAEAPAEGPRVSVQAVLAEQGPVFEPDRYAEADDASSGLSGGKKKKSRRWKSRLEIAADQRNERVRTAKRNGAVCRDRHEQREREKKEKEQRARAQEDGQPAPESEKAEAEGVIDEARPDSETGEPEEKQEPPQADDDTVD